MRSMWRGTGIVAVLLLLAAPLAAQGRGQGPARGMGMMRGGPDAMARNPAAVVLEHRAELELTDAQVERLEAIRERVQEQNGPRWAQLREAFGDAEPGEMSVEERQALRERMQALQPVRQEIRAVNRAAGEEIHELLTDAQEAKLRPIMHADRPGRGQGQGMHHRGGRGPRGGGIR